MKIIPRSIALAGLIFFGTLFSFTFEKPDFVERTGQKFIKYQVEREVREQLDSSEKSSLKDKTRFLAGKHKIGIEKNQKKLKDKLPKKIAAAIAKMCRMDCDKRKQLEESIETGYENKLAKFSVAKGILAELIKGKYLEIVQKLTQDVRIFLGSNTILFFLVLAISFLKQQTFRHLLFPSLLLLLATSISSGIYIFGQNWFFTIIYNDYMGFVYLAYTGIIFGLLMDIVFNRARMTTKITDAALALIGSVISSVPC